MRPDSQASTRCPSSASTLRRPFSPASPSPLGFRPLSVTPQPNEAWSSFSPILGQTLDYGGDIPATGSGNSSPREARSPSALAEEEVEIPDWYRVEGSSTIGVPLLPDFELWIALQGGLGAWAKRKAIAEWRLQLAEHKDSEAKRICEEKRARIAKKEADEKRRRDREELQRRVEEDARQRRLKLIAEEERQRRQKEEEELQARILAEKREKMHKPRPCKICSGSGKCVPCEGRGCAVTVYLSPVVTKQTKLISGQLPRGCASCHGSGDGAWWGEFVCGTGACQECGGKGQVRAPVNGWPDCQ